ncbi:MAG: hypothetical protein H6Q10_1095 [Acidobacteria bacterium]|nr:hypothetical protein [Acidobacteriota bacterium]
MIGARCPREAEVIRRGRVGRRPDEGSELADHLASCPACAETAALAAAFRAEREGACPEGHLPSAGLLWWKAELRRRHERARAATHPIVVACLAALVALLIAAAGLAARMAPEARGLLGRLAGAAPRSIPFPGLDLGLLGHPAILLAATAALVLAPVAVVLALSRD